MKNKINIIFTGGHAATTAIAVVQEIKSRNLDWKIFFLGAERAIEGKKAKTLESEFLPKYGVTFLPLNAGRIQRKFTFWTIPSILKIPLGFLQAFYYLIKIRPTAVLSFGGFASAPVTFASKVLGIPVLIHEQTAAAGRANLFAAGFADKIALAREESLKYFPKEKTIITGNPVLKEIISAKREMRGQDKTIFITGGSRGSQNINKAVGLILPRLLSKYTVVHQTGEIDLPGFESLKSGLPENLSEKYTVFSRIDPAKMGKILGEADLIIARAGANTVSDILASGKSSILIPLPISYLDEQTKNAQYAQKFGDSRIVRQADLTPSLLLSKIDSYFSRPKKETKTGVKAVNPDLTAVGKIVDLLNSYVR